MPVPRGEKATTPAEAKTAAAGLGGRVVVKAQVHAGGRGKAGGIKVADDADAAERAARQILGMRLKSPQTPAWLSRASRSPIPEPGVRRTSS